MNPLRNESRAGHSIQFSAARAASLRNGILVILAAAGSALAQESKPASAPAQSKPQSRPVVMSPVKNALFQWVRGALGGPGYDIKCEGVDVADFNGDGLLDLVFATGFVLAPKRQKEMLPQLQINKSTGPGNIQFEDEAAARLPKGFAVQAGMVCAFDMDADGDSDICFAQMGGRPEKLLKNDGKGIFTDVSAEQFPPIEMSSASVEFGDVDSDGDLDLVFSDQGKKTRLFINDGNGKFTDESDARMPAIEVPVAQDATFADVDNDFDLDIIVIGKHKNGQNLFLNDGTGKFTDATNVLGYAGTANNYECEWADLDNDGDVDAFWISIEDMAEGVSKNLLAGSGKLAFEHSRAAVRGHNGDDDNEITLIDYNNDGLLDIVDGALAWPNEKLYRTNPDLTFDYIENGFDGMMDPTCDAGCGDFDRDGRIDYVTAVGESGTGNKVYRNTGSKDTLAPNIQRIGMGAPAAGIFTFKAFVQDQCYDDGQDFLKCKFNVRVEAKNGIFTKDGVAMTPMGGHLFRGSVRLADLKAEPAGAKVTVTVFATDFSGNTSKSEFTGTASGPQ